MPTIPVPSAALWQVTPPSPKPQGTRQRGRSAPVWHSQVFGAEPSTTGKCRATRYEKLTTRMVLLSSLITLGVTFSLHVLNYGLETQTSSTSGTHSNFYKDDE